MLLKKANQLKQYKREFWKKIIQYKKIDQVLFELVASEQTFFSNFDLKPSKFHKTE